MRILVTGATGYIGGRLVPRLLDQGHEVRVVVRDADRVAGRPWVASVEVREADLLASPEALAESLKGVDAAYYLVHSMSGGGDFAERDRRAASNFVTAARGQVDHVIYLGGLLPEGGGSSGHLKSRAETGEILRDGLPTTEFRAGPIIGSGSASFEMVRYLTERLPVMVAPKWILNDVQPIAVRHVLEYLMLALERPPLGVVDIGGESLTFKEMMMGYAKARGLTRRILPVPVLAPALAARWVGLVTPISNRLAVPLIEGIVEPVLADISVAAREFPDIEPIPYQEAVERALNRTGAGQVETRWTSGMGGADETYEVEDWAGVVREVRTIEVKASPEHVFESFSTLGGDRGWLVWNWAWKLRGFLDKIVGGPGLRRGRRHPVELLAGEALDFWRVEEVAPPRKLRLRAEMKVPGRAWLEFEAVPEDGHTRLIQTAIFEPQGVIGPIYWSLLYPAHKLIFSQMVRAIGRAAERTKADASGV